VNLPNSNPHEISTVSGRKAEVVESITQTRVGRVRFQGSYWRARFAMLHTQQDAYPGELVEIIGREGLTLIVRPTSWNGRQKIDISA
jgi:membrane protein implicated in regulation of membrane protease activity